MRMLRTVSVVTLVLLASLALGLIPAAAEQSKPNIILILSDDFGQERYDIFMNNFTDRTWMGAKSWRN